MKKLLGIVAAMAMVLSVVTAAGAWQMPSSDVEVENEWTSVTTVAKANVETGNVSQMGGWYSKVSTGDVYGVSSTALSQVNMTKLPSCALCGWMSGDVEVENEKTHVTTVAKADVETGNVMQFSWKGMQKVYTGDVTFVAADAASVVNYVDFSVDTPVQPH